MLKDDRTLVCETAAEYDFVMLLAKLGLLKFPAGVTGFVGRGKWANKRTEEMLKKNPDGPKWRPYRR